MLRKVFSGLLVCMLMVQAIGFSVYFQVEKTRIQKQLKTKIKLGVPDTQLTHFDFSRKDYAQLTFLKKEKEFKFGERLYDIVHKKISKNGRINLKCVHDIQETRLFKHLAYYVGKTLNKQSKHGPLKISIATVQTPYILNQEFPELFLQFYFSRNIKLNLYNNNYSFLLIQEMIKPPSLCV